MFDVLIIGGGASGFYAAIHIAESNPNLKIGILEKGKDVLAKVRISGGGRCNVTHAEFDPKELVKNYPRGEKELLGPFHKYCSGDTVGFFQERGVNLKIEEDGRMFPESNTSQTIIDCFLEESAKLGIKVLKHSAVTNIEFIKESLSWNITTIKNEYHCTKLLIASGSSPKIWSILKNLGHTIVSPVPSLFTFNIKDQRITGIPGVSTIARVKILPKKRYQSNITVELKSKPIAEPLLETEGPLLITHWGMSGPAILKLSAWGANMLHDVKYKFDILVNWLPEFHEGAVIDYLLEIKEVEAKKTVLRTKTIEVPKRLWINLVKACGISDQIKWADITKIQLQGLAEQLTNCKFTVDGKSTFKDEFVTAGGVDLKEVNFKTYGSKKLPNLFFAGEVLNIDAITGGFNFQNAWTSGYLAAQGIVSEFKED
ncbi:NAD(P)/FAD-dependent oxidoreductase [uncultured Maribacter sp.]|uniref:NAD(P)/FAD-dependent oxidoreductase n=1 Tax=uncultured Maribacter sp. TaxID=431308 RepID=UPI002613690F|nr:NAD(P)/FAD-dependent oxidoreductase [uncultured Maribacter sp.]